MGMVVGKEERRESKREVPASSPTCVSSFVQAQSAVVERTGGGCRAIIKGEGKKRKPHQKNKREAAAKADLCEGRQ